MQVVAAACCVAKCSTHPSRICIMSGLLIFEMCTRAAKMHAAKPAPLPRRSRQVLDQVRAAGAVRALPALRDHVAQLSRMCAAVRASLETHLR